MKLLKLFKRNGPVKIRVVERPVTELRADEFRADQELVRLAATVLANPNMQLMLSVMRNEHPGFEVLPSSADSVQRIVWQSRAEGFSICLATLESLGVRAVLAERLESTFAKENEAAI